MSMLPAKKSLGQHFLTNTHVVKHMIESGEVTRGDTVLEIGPGTGVLTRALLEKGATVVAVEADKRAVDILRETFPESCAKRELILHHADIRDIDIASLGLVHQEYKVVANIPYYISGMLFTKMLSGTVKPSLLVFLVQKEVAERIARSKKESLLSLSIKAYGTPTYVKTVRKGNFTPPPSVDSALLKVSDISQVRLGDCPDTWFFTVLRAGLRSKRKQLFSNLLTYFHETVTKTELESMFSTLGIARNIRGEDVPLEIWVQLASTLLDHRDSSSYNTRL